MAAHLIFELAAYIIAFRLLLFRNLNHDTLPLKQRSFVLVGALLGAIVGVKFLLVFQYFNIILEEPSKTFNLFFGTGKTIVGGLLGGLIGVEITKKILHINSSTGDVFVYPLIVGIIIGRIGCFLAGLEDETFGLPTNLPWGVDFGDGIARHPTQIYEIIFLCAWAGFLRWCSRFQLESGDLFKLFMIGYLSFRLGIDFLKPHPFNWLVFSGIQIACLLGLIYYHQSILRLLNLLRGKSYDAKRLSVLRSDQ